MLKGILFTTLALLTVTGCVSMKREFRVYRGELIKTWKKNPYQFIVMLDGLKICTGCIINAMTVVSAGHCFTNPFAVPTVITLEHTGLENTVAKTIKISASFIPGKYQAMHMEDPMNGEDISVVRLEERIDVRNFAHTVIKLSVGKLEIGSVVVIVGYGENSYHNGDSEILRKGKAFVSECGYNPKDERICAKAVKFFSYQRYEVGDSGAPIISRINGEYLSTGFLSGDVTYKDGSSEMVFASYKRHKRFIENHAWEN